MDQTCAKCKGSMEEGFILDQGYARMTAALWVAGPPEKSAFLGLKLGGKRQIPLQTLRCVTCGYLESYAK